MKDMELQDIYKFQRSLGNWKIIFPITSSKLYPEKVLYPPNKQFLRSPSGLLDTVYFCLVWVFLGGFVVCVSRGIVVFFHTTLRTFQWQVFTGPCLCIPDHELLPSLEISSEKIFEKIFLREIFCSYGSISSQKKNSKHQWAKNACLKSYHLLKSFSTKGHHFLKQFNFQLLSSAFLLSWRMNSLA